MQSGSNFDNSQNNQSINKSIYPSIHPYINQSINQPTNQSINRSINQSINQSTTSVLSHRKWDNDKTRTPNRKSEQTTIKRQQISYKKQLNKNAFKFLAKRSDILKQSDNLIGLTFYLVSECGTDSGACVTGITFTTVKGGNSAVADLVIKQHGAARLKLIFVNKRQYADVVLTTNRSRHNRMVIINDLLQGTDRHRRSTQVIHFWPLLLWGSTRTTFLTTWVTRYFRKMFKSEIIFWSFNTQHIWLHIFDCFLYLNTLPTCLI